MDYLTLGPVPADEICQQVGTVNYDAERARQECTAYKHQLRRLFPLQAFYVKSFPHDFGTYMEVCVSDDSPEAFAVENNLPTHWDTEAREELGYLPAEGFCKQETAAQALLELGGEG